MRPQILESIICVGVGALILVSLSAQQVYADSCPAVTVSNNHGIVGKYPGQFEHAGFEQLASCTLSFSGNPDIGELNTRIGGNPAELPPAAERIPSEPLVIAPQDGIGKYGGVLDFIVDFAELWTGL